MFKPILLYDLQQIFDIDRIIFTTQSVEQECLRVDLLDTKSSPRQGFIVYRVRGIISFFFDKARIKYGYITERLVRSTYIYKNRFLFGSIESCSTDIKNARSQRYADYEDSFVSSYLPFTYYLRLSYNPPLGKIEVLEIR